MDALEVSLDLLRRLQPAQVKNDVDIICSAVPSIAEELLSSIDQPLGIMTCSKTSKDYLTCDYNRDADSYRSPWSNVYNPPLHGGALPSDQLRELELLANDSFNVYREMYYEGGISSVYMWDLEDDFAGVVLLRKSEGRALWNSIHVFEAMTVGRKCNYRLTSTIILSVYADDAISDKLHIEGSLTRQSQQEAVVESPTVHISNIGKIVEDMELKMRALLQEVYFGKAKDIVGEIRCQISRSSRKEDEHKHREIIRGMGTTGVST